MVELVVYEVVQIVVLLHHVYQRVRSVLIEVIYGSDYTETASRGVAQPVILNESRSHVYVDILSEKCSFPSFIYPANLFSFTEFRSTFVSLWIEAEILLTCLSVVGLYEFHCSERLPAHLNHTHIPIEIIRQRSV